MILNFSSVTCIDEEGPQPLKKRLICQRIIIVGCNMFLKDLIKGTKLEQSLMRRGRTQGHENRDRRQSLFSEQCVVDSDARS